MDLMLPESWVRRRPPAQLASVLCLECDVRSVVEEPRPGSSITCPSCTAEIVVGVLRVERGRRRRRRGAGHTVRSIRRSLRSRTWQIAIVLYLIAVCVVIAAYPDHARTTYSWLQRQLADQASQQW